MVLIIPGPTIILVISQSIRHGKKAAIPLVLGVLLGDFTAMTASLLGLGAVIATSATVFSIFKWIGAVYLIYLGIKMFNSNPQNIPEYKKSEDKPLKSFFKDSYIVTALNPKSIAFFVAFLPQFINPAKTLLPQLLLLGTTFLILAVINAALYAVFAVRLNKKIKHPIVQKWFNRCGGSALIGAGIITAKIKQV